MKKTLLILIALLTLSCATDKNSDWDSGAVRTQADQSEENAELQQNIRNQAPVLTP